MIVITIVIINIIVLSNSQDKNYISYVTKLPI